MELSRVFFVSNSAISLTPGTDERAWFVSGRQKEKHHALTRVSTRDVRGPTGLQSFVREAPVNLLLVADLAETNRASEKDVNLYTAADAVFILQNAYLCRASEGARNSGAQRHGTGSPGEGHDVGSRSKDPVGTHSWISREIAGPTSLGRESPHRFCKDFPSLGTTIEDHVPCGKIGEEIAPELGIDGSRDSEPVELDSGILKLPGIQVFQGGALHQIPRASERPADVHDEAGSLRLDSKLREQDDFGVDGKELHEVKDDVQVHVQQPIVFRGKEPFDERRVFGQVWRMAVGGPDAFEMFSRPPAIVADSHLVDPLQAQPFLQRRYSEPQGALSVLEAVSADPGRPEGILHRVQYDECVGQTDLVKEPHEGGKIRLMRGNDHLSRVPFRSAIVRRGLSCPRPDGAAAREEDEDRGNELLLQPARVCVMYCTRSLAFFP